MSVKAVNPEVVWADRGKSETVPLLPPRACTLHPSPAVPYQQRLVPLVQRAGRRLQPLCWLGNTQGPGVNKSGRLSHTSRLLQQGPAGTWGCDTSGAITKQGVKALLSSLMPLVLEEGGGWHKSSLVDAVSHKDVNSREGLLWK